MKADHQKSPSIEPEQAFVAIGDIHGRADLLDELDRRIEGRFPGWPRVYLGDYIDRGEQSREVLESLIAVSAGDGPQVTCLMGNHEQMMLDFLDDPVSNAHRWLRNGGLQTLGSFGVAPPKGTTDDPSAFHASRDRLMNAMGPEMTAWLKARPLSWRSGNVWAVHAGADPGLPMDMQPRDGLLWGHPAFLLQPRADGQSVVHGHTVVHALQYEQGRIALDTGAYATGRLSAAAISADGINFIQTGAE